MDRELLRLNQQVREELDELIGAAISLQGEVMSSMLPDINKPTAITDGLKGLKAKYDAARKRTLEYAKKKS